MAQKLGCLEECFDGHAVSITAILEVVNTLFLIFSFDSPPLLIHNHAVRIEVHTLFADTGDGLITQAG